MKILSIILLSAFAAAQVPQGVNISMDERFAPELGVLMYWQPVAGASSYNVYKAVASISQTKCPATLTLDENVTASTYSDSPFPGWYLVPVANGRWKGRAWCYAVSSIVPTLVNGVMVPVESAQSPAQFIAIGWSGYVNISYLTTCSGGKTVVPFPYQLNAHFYYRDPADPNPKTQNHEFSSVTVHAPFGDPAHYYNQEWEIKLPTIANDGTIIPWSKDAFYYYELRTPDGGNYAANAVAPYQLDQSYYTQITLNRVLGGPDCQRNNYSFWQNVTR